MDCFLDTSAVVKRYVQEVGSAWVDSLALTGGNVLFVAGITGAEAVSAIVRRGRSGTLTAAQTVKSLADFRQDFANAYQILPVTPAVIARAMGIAERHALRGYDAVQLAAALELNAQRLAFGLPALVFVSSDAALNAAASAETLPTDDPNAHP